MIRGGGEPGHIGDDAAAERDHHVGPGQAGAGELATELLHGGQGLGGLTVADGADLEGQAGVETVQPPGPGHRILGDHDGALGRAMA